ncbi:MAG: glycosyltransferase family 39 protein [Prosthecobacter sp.]
MAAFASLTDRSSRGRFVAVFALLLVFLTLSLGQAWRLGGFDSDLAGDPDEGAHAVTALMMRDYLATGLPHGQSPLAFAEHYYQVFPKVALGHYPPGYYLPAAAALALWGDPRALIALQCVLVAVLGVAVFCFMRRVWPGEGGVFVGLLTALAVVLQGEVARVSVHVLADLLLVLLVFAAALVWMAWLREPSWRRSLGFGCLAAAAILTKGSALGLAGIPVISLLLTRRWADLKKLSWWGAAIPVVLFAVPWMLWSVRFTQEGFTGDTPAAFFLKAVGEYAQMAPWFFGWPLLLLLALAFVRVLVDAVRSPAGLDVQRACLWATCLGMQGLAMVVPAGFSPRYLLPSLIPVLILAVLEIPRWLASRGPRVSALVAGLLLCTTTWLVWRERPKDAHGYSAAVDTVLARANSRADRAWLVSADGRGEGALIAAAAFRTADRGSATRRILRGSKELADTDWVSSHYVTKFPTEAALLAFLDKARVDAVLVDLSVAAADLKPHETQLKNTLDAASSIWQRLPAQPVRRTAPAASGGRIEMYQRIPAGGGGTAP